MLIFHKEGNFIKVKNPTTNNIVLTLPSVSCTLATKKDLENISMAAGSIKQPTFVTPVNNVIGFAGEFVISPYEANDNFAGEQTHVSIEISTNNNFTDLIVSQKLELTTNLLTMLVDLSLTKVYVRVKYHSGVYCSLWSDTIAYTTPEFYILKPTLLGPIGNNTALIPFLSTTDFGYVGLSDTHDSTTYQIATDELFSKIVYNITTDIDLLGHLLLEDLDYETTYYIRARHIGTKYGNSLWSDTVTINTIVVDEKIISITNVNAAGFHYKEDEITNNIYLGGGLFVNGIQLPAIYKLNANLDIIDYRLLKDSSITVTTGSYETYVYHIESDADNIFVTINYGTAGKAIIVKLDKNLNIILTKYLSNLVGELNTIKIVDEKLYIAGTLKVGTPENAYGMIVCFDKNLNHIKTVTTDMKHYGWKTSLTVDDENNLYLANSNTTTALGFCNIFKFDKNLNLLNSIRFGKDFTYAPRDIYFYKNYLYVVAHDVFYKIDKNLNIVTCKRYQSPSYFDTMCFYEDSIFVSGYGAPYGNILVLDLDLNLIHNYAIGSGIGTQTYRCSEVIKNKMGIFTGSYGYDTDNLPRMVNVVVDLENITEYNASVTTAGLYRIFLTTAIPDTALAVYKTVYSASNLTITNYTSYCTYTNLTTLAATKPYTLISATTDI